LQAVGPHQFRFALGAGTFSEEENLGEALVIEGRPHASWLRRKTLHTEGHADIRTPFLMGLDWRAEGGILLHYKPSPFPALQLFYHDLMLEYPKGVAIAGYVIFDELQSTYLVKPPIYDENVNEHADRYWAKTHIDKQQHACVFGVAISEEASKKYPKKVLERAFYHNPHEATPSVMLSHTHGGLTAKKEMGSPHKVEEFFQQLEGMTIQSVRHVLTSSTIKEGVFVLFPL
jgi:hypothetical protein